MDNSPRRPLILRRRKLPLTKKEDNGPHDEPDGPKSKPAGQCFPDSVRVMDHPSMPDTQVLIVPRTADLQCVIDALTAKGKQCGPGGPSKFILLGGNGSESRPESFTMSSSGTENSATFSTQGGESTTPKDWAEGQSEVKPLTAIKPFNKELDCIPLDDSLTNIHWLGRISSSGLGCNSTKNTCKKEMEDCDPKLLQPTRESEEVPPTTKDPMADRPPITKDALAERPPYSYMAMIQFAINSKKNRRMTLKEIYTWIEDHFPYFRNVAKPGWKNSIRHNLSLHDMFIRESSADGKVSYWTIRPEANRCLTLDQVYRLAEDPAASPPAHTPQVSDQQQQKLTAPEVKKTAAGGFERKMKPLLPRTSSYFVPIQLPIAPSFLLPSVNITPTASQQNGSVTAPSTQGGGKRVRIAPKTTGSQVAHPRRESSSSRRKQRLVQAPGEEPLLLFPNSTFFDSGLASDLSDFGDTQEADAEPQLGPGSECNFKTPVKCKNPASSTPSKFVPTPPDPWRSMPSGPDAHSLPDVSPIQAAITPQRQRQNSFSPSGTPFKELSFFGLPSELLPDSLAFNDPQMEGVDPSATNRSFTEGLVLDTTNDSLSKILVDISFPALEGEDLGIGNISWSQLIPELK